MKDTCTLKLSNGKWHVYGPDGKCYCGFDYPHKQWAEDVAAAHGWKIVAEEKLL